MEGRAGQCPGRRGVALTLGLAALLLAAGLAQPGGGLGHTEPHAQAPGGAAEGPDAGGAQAGAVSNGRWIYQAGVSTRTGRVPFRGGPMWLRMHGGGCAACHGADGRGGTPVMMVTKIPPDIRYASLTAATHHHDHEGAGEAGESGHGSHSDHPRYTDALIRRAVVDGLDPAGRPLDPTMPRWQLSDEDFRDLLAYLRTLR